MVNHQTSSAKKTSLIRFALSFIVLIALYAVSTLLFKRFDLTSEKRFSVSKPTQQVLKNLDDVVFIRIYLEGNLPSGFKKLQESTKNILEEFRAYGGSQVEFAFFNPDDAKTEKDKKAIFDELTSKGLAPVNLMVKEDGEQKQKIIFPGAVIGYKGREYPVSLLENQIGFSPQEALNHSEVLLEYKFINAIKKLQQFQPPGIGFTKNHGELSDEEMADLHNTLMDNQYQVARVDLDSAIVIPKNINVLVIAKPRFPFSDQQKFKIDQYVMRGGKVIWLLEGTNASMDSLQKDFSGQFVQNTELNLDDMPYKYGARINNDLAMDVNLCNPIPLVVGQMGNAPQTQLFPWYYFPVCASPGNHSINKNIDPVAMYFASSIDTIKVPGIKKTVLLQTSANSRALLTPARVHFGILKQKPNPESFNQPNLNMAVLLEGEFHSTYENRVTPEFLAATDSISEMKFISKSTPNKMIVIGDGDVARNELRSDGGAYPLGYYKYSRQQFANKDFLLNCIEFLIDDSGIFETRNKEIKLRLLNNTKVENEKLFWQIINVVLPVLLVIICGYFFIIFRRRKYGNSF